jgi:allantoin racemase
LRLLLINPNTSAHITERLAASARLALVAGDALTAVTAVDGPRVVRSAAELQQAEASALALAAMHAPTHDAVVLAISLDGAAVRLREAHPGVPVVGMTEAALLIGCLRAERLGLLTLGASLLPLYRERIAQIGLASRVVACEAPELPAAFGADSSGVSPEVLAGLEPACRRLSEAGAQAVVLAGAVLCGYAAALQARCGLPVHDGVSCAVRLARVQLDERRSG